MTDEAIDVRNLTAHGGRNKGVPRYVEERKKYDLTFGTSLSVPTLASQALLNSESHKDYTKVLKGRKGLRATGNALKSFDFPQTSSLSSVAFAQVDLFAIDPAPRISGRPLRSATLKSSPCYRFRLRIDLLREYQESLIGQKV